MTWPRRLIVREKRQPPERRTAPNHRHLQLEPAVCSGAHLLNTDNCYQICKSSINTYDSWRAQHAPVAILLLFVLVPVAQKSAPRRDEGWFLTISFDDYYYRRYAALNFSNLAPLSQNSRQTSMCAENSILGGLSSSTELHHSSFFPPSAILGSACWCRGSPSSTQTQHTQHTRYFTHRSAPHHAPEAVGRRTKSMTCNFTGRYIESPRNTSRLMYLTAPSVQAIP